MRDKKIKLIQLNSNTRFRAGILFSKNMNITYYVQQSISDTQSNTVQITDDFKKATEYFEYYCKLNPSGKYKIIKRETVDKTIAESTDILQETFEFA